MQDVLGGHSHPRWYHRHGCKLKVASTDLQKGVAVFQSSAAEVIISLMTGIPGETRRSWRIEWSILHNVFGHAKVVGTVSLVSDGELKAAFGILERPKTEPHSVWLLNRYGGDWALQGLGIRQGCHLNIPCPGTGSDGDPNVSICIDDDIKVAIVQLFEFSTN